MYKDFKEYNQAYLIKYNTNLIINKKNFKNKLNFFHLFLLLFLSFIFFFSISFDKSFHSVLKKIIKNEKLITDFGNEKKIYNFNQSFIKPTYIFKNDKNIVLKKEGNVILNSTDIIKNHLVKISSSKQGIQLSSLKWQSDFSRKKAEFIKILLPLIAFQNQQILIERNRLFKIKKYLIAQKTLPREDLLYLNNLAHKYFISKKNKHKVDLVEEVLKSANVIPTSIVLAQAANESGWGTSRFAKEYNALFGQYTYDEKNGIIPSKREEGKKHLIKYFSSIDKSVESYFKNINTHYAYEKFRNLRNQMNNNFNIKTLTKTLDVYAEDKSYVDTINAIIDSNNLMQFDSINHIFTSS